MNRQKEIEDANDNECVAKYEVAEKLREANEQWEKLKQQGNCIERKISLIFRNVTE